VRHEHYGRVGRHTARFDKRGQLLCQGTQLAPTHPFTAELERWQRSVTRQSFEAHACERVFSGCRHEYLAS
jgi:hypothetical protein